MPDLRPQNERRLVRREVPPVVFEDHSADRVDQAVGRVARDEVDPAAGERLVEESEIHLHGPLREAEAVGPREPGETVFALEELVSETGPDLRVRRQVGDLRDVKARRVVAAHDERESVLETEGSRPDEVPALPVLLRDFGSDDLRLRDRFTGEDRGECGSGVLRIEAELAGLQGLMTDERAAQVQPAVDAHAAGLESLRRDFTQYDLLGEILRPDPGRRFAFPMAGARERQKYGEGSARFHVLV